jgi:hypothetical protein
MTERKRATSSSSNGSPNKKGGGERLIDSSRNCIVVGDTFVSGEGNISADLVDKVSKKACEFYMTFTDPPPFNKYYFGQGGFIRGEMLAAMTRPDDDVQPEQKRRKVEFQEDPHYEATPLTAKHNLKSQGTETYLRTLVRWFDKVETDIVLLDGGCKMTEHIQVCPAKATKNEITWNADDISFGDKITDPSKLTEASRLFEKIPNDFKVCVGHKIGALVYCTFDITHDDAKAPPDTDLVQVYGQKFQVCIYTGQVTEISANGQTFCHDINTFEGCSGAIIFLLDQNQPDDVAAEFHGMAVGINVGGLDKETNIGFLINEKIK